METRIVWVCKKCGKVEDTKENEIPDCLGECLSQYTMHDWIPVKIYYI